MAQTNHDIVDLNVDKVSLVGEPANGQDFLSLQKEAPSNSPVSAASRAIQSLLANPAAQLSDQDRQLLQQVGEFLKTLDADHSQENQLTPDAAAAQHQATPGQVREALEGFLIDASPELQESLKPAFWKAFDLVKDLDEPPVLSIAPKAEGRRVLQESARIVAAADDAGWQWDVCIIESGDSKNGVWNNGDFIPRHYPLETLQKHAHLFEGSKVYVYEFKGGAGGDRYDHLTEKALEANPHGYAKNLVGVISRPRIDGTSLMGTIRLLKGADWLRTNLQDSVSMGRPDLYGLSIDCDGSQHLGRIGGKNRLIVDALHDVRSVDVVTHPAAGGRFLRLVASRSPREIPNMGNELEQKLARFEERQALTSILKESGLPTLEQMKIRKRFIEAESIDFDKLELAIREANMALQSAGKGAKVMCDDDEGDFEQANDQAGKGKKAPADETMQESLIDRKLKSFVDALQADHDKKMAAFEHKQKLTESQQYLFSAVAQSGLPTKAQEKLLRIFKGRVVESAVIDREIEDMRELTAANDRSGELRVGGPRDVRVTESEWDKMTTALDGFWANKNLNGPDGHPIRQMRSLREAFELMTGQRYDNEDFIRESKGLPGRSYTSKGRYGVQYEGRGGARMTEALSTSSWAQILGDSITRRMLAEYNVPSLQTWRQIVSEVGNIKDFRTQRRMRIGGYGLLPTVGQGDSYTALTSPTDQEATYAVSKRGGTEVITLEMMANDDVGALRRIPLRLGRAAAQTLYRFVFDLIANNSALSFDDDTAALFHSSHSNIGSAALNPDSLEAALIRMKRQTAYGNATEVLGLVPRFILHPPDLWRTVDKLVNTKSGEPFTQDNDNNPFLQLKLQPIEIYYWTDTNNWYLVANPSDIPTIEVGFYEGNEDPEIFVSDQENISNSSMFSADKITYKIRHIYGAGVLEYRGFDGSIVA
jgi:hypothetical protein